MTRLMTPFGNPARDMISISIHAVPGTRSAGLNTTVLPKASAGAIFQAGMAIGKFHGQISPTTPNRLLHDRHIDARPHRGDRHAFLAQASCAKNLKICAARVVSAMPLASGFPSSRDSMRPTSSLRASNSTFQRTRAHRRAAAASSATSAGNAALAAAIAFAPAPRRPAHNGR